MVSTILIAVALAVVGIIATVGVSQTEQFQGMFKPSATQCEFSGQRLSQNYYCVYRNDIGNHRQYLDVEEISENQIPTCSGMRIEAIRVDASGIGKFIVNKDSACSDTLKVIGVGSSKIYPNLPMKSGETKVSVPFNIGTSLPEGSIVPLSVQFELSSAVQQARVLPAGQVPQEQIPSPTPSPSNNQQQAGGNYAQDVQFYQRIFVKDLFNGDVSIPYSTGISTSNAKSIEFVVEGNSNAILNIQGTDCAYQGFSFDKICNVPSNTDVVVMIEGSGYTHLTLKLHYIL